MTWDNVRDRACTSRNSRTFIPPIRLVPPFGACAGTCSQIRTIRDASLYRQRPQEDAAYTLKMAVLAPTPSASVTTTTAVNPGVLRSERSE